MRKAMIGAGIAAAALALTAGGVQAGDTDGDTPEPAAVVECELLAADVVRETTSFTVGPEGCAGEVGPISFSAFLLPGGMREPYEDQVLIAHHESNGAFYGAGSYQLSIDMGTPCNWQTDLYYGVDLTPKFQYLIAYDYDEREVCADETTTTTSSTSTTSTSTTTTTLVDSGGGEATTTSTTSTTTSTEPAANETTTTTDAAAAVRNPTTTSVASAGPVPPPASAGGTTLPATGPSETSVLALLAGLLVAAGLLVRRVART